MQGFPVIYILDDNGEATGSVYRFCSSDCRQKADMKNPTFEQGNFVFGNELDLAADGEVCCECGTELTQL